MAEFVEFRAVFSGPLVYWRGPSPFHFVPVPAAQAAEIQALAPVLTYGWGAIPARVRIGRTDFTTAMFPKDGGYLVPVKDAVRRAEGLALGDTVIVELRLGG
ncbi:MAG TPA: DUF1905 domain-containing protein [Candidatus Limnocylindrales bacterium]